MFCSPECREVSYFHKVECPIVSYLWKLDMPSENYLALRMLTQTPLSNFIALSEKGIADKHPEKIMTFNDNLSPEQNLLFVYNLCHHEANTPTDELLKYAILAAFYIKILWNTR